MLQPFQLMLASVWLPYHLLLCWRIDTLCEMWQIQIEILSQAITPVPVTRYPSTHVIHCNVWCNECTAIRDAVWQIQMYTLLQASCGVANTSTSTQTNTQTQTRTETQTQNIRMYFNWLHFYTLSLYRIQGSNAKDTMCDVTNTNKNTGFSYLLIQCYAVIWRFNRMCVLYQIQNTSGLQYCKLNFTSCRYCWGFQIG